MELCRLNVFEKGTSDEFLGPRGMRMRSGEGFYHSRNIVRVIKSRRSRWIVHVARIEEGRIDFKVLISKLTGKIIFRRSSRR